MNKTDTSFFVLKDSFYKVVFLFSTDKNHHPSEVQTLKTDNLT